MTPTPTPPTPRRRRSLRRAKAYLSVLMLIGGAAYFGGEGTFASFTAEVTNAGSTLASGTLTMNDTVASNAACKSLSAASVNNDNNSCTQLFTAGAAGTAGNLEPGSYSTVTVQIANSGSLNASKFTVQAASTNTNLTSITGNGGVIATGTFTLTVSALEGNISSGDVIVLSDGSHTTGSTAGVNECTATSAVAGGATSIPLTCTIPVPSDYAYPANTIVTDNSAPTTSNADCYDSQTTVGQGSGSTGSFGTQLNFNPITGNPMCGTALLFVQETTAGNDYCWAGKGVTTAGCTTPTSATLSSNLSTSGAITSIPVAALTGNVASGDTITLTSGANTQTFTTNAAAFIGATSIPVTSQTPTFAFPTASTTVVDTTSTNALNSDTSDTITTFDTAHGSTGPLTLSPTTGVGTINNAATTDLSAGTTRSFVIGIYVPLPTGINQNYLQGLQSTFGITWQLSQ